MESHEFEITPGPWSTKIILSENVSHFIFTIRDSHGNRVESGLADDLTIDVEGTQYPVRSKSAIREDMQEIFGYSAIPDDLDAQGGQDAGVIQLSMPTAVKEIYLHAKWPETIGPNGKLEILARGGGNQQ